MPLIITVAGDIGSGKSAVCAELTRRTGWRVISTGALFRGVAAKRGMTVLELNQYVDAHGGVDAEIDGYLASLAGTEEPLLVDSRLAWHFLPGSVKVFLTVHPVIAGNRVFGAARADEHYASPAEALAASLARKRVEADRYRKLYGVETEDWNNFDLVVDTSHAPPDAIAAFVLDRAAAHSGEQGVQLWLSPRRLLPTTPVGAARPADTVPPADGHDGAGVTLAECDGSFLIVGGHAEVRAALQAGARWVRCRMWPSAEVTPDLPVAAWARATTSLAGIAAWEAEHGFSFESLPAWIAGASR